MSNRGNARFGSRSAAWVVAALIGLSAGIAQGLPAKDYNVQETTRCSYGQGCQRMLGNAVNEARAFCQAEGGVLRGESPRDFRCEQRAIYCVVTGRIECRGRLDPTASPGQVLGVPTLPIPKKREPTGRTCLEASCNRYIDHAPGRRESGVHACPNGYAMIGLSGRGNDIVCQLQETPIIENLLDHDTMRERMHGCPKGSLMRGVSDDLSALLCSRVRRGLGKERVQDETDNFGLQVCQERDGVATWLTGIDGARNGLLCAPLN